MTTKSKTQILKSKKREKNPHSFTTDLKAFEKLKSSFFKIVKTSVALETVDRLKYAFC